MDIPHYVGFRVIGFENVQSNPKITLNLVYGTEYMTENRI